MAEIQTLRKYEIKTDDNGLITVPIDVCTADGGVLERRSFYLSTGAAVCTMRAADLTALGYDVSAAVTLPLIRIGAYDFIKIPVEVTDSNTIGASVLKWLNFSVSNSENTFEADLIQRLKQIVEKGVNPNIKPAYLSSLKPSDYNDNCNWYTWAEIDRLFPDSWVLLLGGDDELDYGGEVVWYSQTEVPDTSQKDTFLYCNKSVAAQKPFLVQYTGNARCRGFAAPDPAYSVYVEELESKLAPPVINRFYYDTVSRQGKLFAMSHSSGIANTNPDAVLTQDAIDALFAQMLDGDESAFQA